MENFFNLLKNIVLASETFDKIIILGKGSTVTSIDPSTYKNSFIININDSERIQKGNLCLFKNAWVLESLNENGFQAQNYVTVNETMVNANFAKDKFNFVDYNNISFESFDSLISDFNSRDFYLSDFLVLSALKVAYLISQIKNKNLKSVYASYITICRFILVPTLGSYCCAPSSAAPAPFFIHLLPPPLLHDDDDDNNDNDETKRPCADDRSTDYNRVNRCTHKTIHSKYSSQVVLTHGVIYLCCRHYLVGSKRRCLGIYIRSRPRLHSCN